jgi:hypothetical protein
MIRSILYVGLLLCFIPVTLFGWNWASDSAPGWMKFHPVTYLFAVGAMIGLGTLRLRFWRPFLSWSYGPFAAMTLVFIVRAVMIASDSSDSTGAVGIAITSFLTPVLFLVLAAAMGPEDWRPLGVVLRVLLVINSVVALVETVLKTSFVFVQEGHIFRAGGLLGHPLSSALVTGYVLVYLLTANNRRGSLLSALPEVVLHAAAMFAFGGRTGLVLVPLIVTVSAILPSPKVPIVQRIARRLGVLAILVGALMTTQLQIEAVQTALARFQSDSGSADTRYAAVEMIGDLRTNDLLWGVNAETRQQLLVRYDSELGFENPWVSLILSYGIVLVIPMAVALVVALFAYAWSLDRSAAMMALYFLISSSSSVSFGTKSLIVMQVFLFMSALCQRRDVSWNVRSPRSFGAVQAARGETVIG